MPPSLERFRAAERRLWDGAGVVPTERRLPLRSGPRVRVQEVGAGDPVLFVHGAANGGTSWVELAAALDGFRCILLDRPGCALSDPIDGGLRDVEAIEGYADSLVADVLDALDLPSAHVVATSYGGYFALRGAAAAPDRVRRLVELSWPFGAPMEAVPFTMRITAIPGLQALTTRMPVSARTAKMILRQVGLRRALETGAFTDDMVEWFVALLSDTDTMRNELRASPKVITTIRGVNQRILLPDELLARVTMPALFLWGEEDPNGGAAVARDFVARLPNATLEMIPEAGHAPWIDELDRCVRRIGEFLVS